MKKYFSNIINSIWFKTIIVCLFSLSIGCLSIFLMIKKVNFDIKLITFLTSFSFSFIIIYRNYNRIIKKLSNNNYYNVICFLSSCLVFFCFKRYLFSMKFENRIFSNNYFYLVTFPGMALIISLLLCEIKKWLNSFINDMTSSEKKIHIVISIIMLFVLYFLYRDKPIFYTGYDSIYSFDSGWFLESMLADLYYYDIRHPLMSIITFPVYSSIDFIFNFDIKVVLLQLINVQLILLIGLELKKITNNKYVYYMFLISFPTISYLLFLEKYVICVFFITTYIYNLFVRKKDSFLLFPLIVGTMPTNIYTIFFEFFRDNKIKKKILSILKIGVICLLIFVVFGRLHCFFNGFKEIDKMKKSFAKVNYTIVNKINATSNMIEGSFIALPSSYNNGKYLWNDNLNRFSYLSIVIIALMLIGLIKEIKNKKYYYLCFLSSFIFSLILFIGLNWAVKEAPLFSFCFSWAMIPLLVSGIDFILGCFKIKRKSFIYCLLIISIFIINVLNLIDICKYY